MLKACMDADERFGIILIKTGQETGNTAAPRAIGTVAKIIQVNEVAEGRFFLSVKGEQRFRLCAKLNNRPYPFGEIEMIVDETSGDDLHFIANSVRHEAEKMINLIIGLDGGWSKHASLPNDPAVLSYHIPKLLGIDLLAKQKLLEDTTAGRLRSELSLLKAQADIIKSRIKDDLRGRFSDN